MFHIKNKSSSNINDTSLIVFFAFILISLSAAKAQNNNINFQPPPIRNFQTGCSATDITAADFNGDGLIDIAVCSIGYSVVSVILNITTNEDIFFSDPITFDVGWEPQALVSGDFDLDGKMDIITINQSTSDITILRNTSKEGSLNFDVYAGNDSLGDFPQDIVADDFNGDGRLDLAIDGIFILRNISSVGRIAFELENRYYQECYYGKFLKTDDFDGDGKIDLVARNRIYRNTSSGDSVSFASPYIIKLYFATDDFDFVSSCDFDADGRIDIRAFNTSGILYEFRNASTPGNLSFEKVLRIDKDAAISSLNNCDLNGDSIPEIVFASPAVLFGDQGTNNFIDISSNQQNLKFQVANDPQSLTSADFDNDGKIDIAVGCASQSHSVSIVKNISTSSDIKVSSAFAIPSLGNFRGMRDFNRDGNSEIITAGNHFISFYRNTSSITFDFSKLGTYESPYYLNFSSESYADFNNDDKLDIVANGKYGPSDSEITYGNIVLLKNNSTKNTFTFIADSIDIVGGRPLSNQLADFNGDGKMDIIIYRKRFDGLINYYSLLILENNCSIDSMKFSPSYTIEGNVADPAIADFDNDTLVDLIIPNSLNIFHNESSPDKISFSDQGKVSSSLGPMENLYCNDFDKDGLIDLFAIMNHNTGYYIFKNKSVPGNIRFEDPIYYPPSVFLSTYALFNDINDDNKTDIIICNSRRQFSILENISIPGSIQFSPVFPGTIILGKTFWIYDLDDDGYKEIIARDSFLDNQWKILRTLTTPFTIIKNISKDFPASYELEQNYPNPFNPTTTINYILPKNTEVSLKIYNVLGQLVRTLVDTKQMAGNYSIRWDGADEYGRSVASGVYLYSLRAGEFVQVRKMLFVQ